MLLRVPECIRDFSIKNFVPLFNLDAECRSWCIVMDILILKLVLAPLLIATATLAVRRWGFFAGGLFTGLPLTSGPVSLFLAIERGPRFAGQGSIGMLLGTVALVTFCVAYVRTARGQRWLPPMVIGFIAYCLAAWGLSFLSFSLEVVTVLVLLFLWVAVKLAGPPVTGPSQIASPSWDIPLRMVSATAMVLIITGGAVYLGPKWSGILAPFPAFTCIMAVFAQKQNGALAAHGLMRGAIIGCLGAISFYFVIGFVIEPAGIAAAYLLATVTSVAVNGLCLAVLMLRATLRKF